MPKSPEELLAIEIGGVTIAERLRQAIERGDLIEHSDGSLGLPPTQGAPTANNAIFHAPHKYLDCRFLLSFLFNIVYSESAVPWGCASCYKVVVNPANLRGLMALRNLQKSIDCVAKTSVEVDRTITQNIYVGFFYCITLERAREVYWIVRAAVDAEPKLGPETPVRIKRGCTEYEIHCGPSDQYTFHPDLPELEAYLLSRFRHPPKPQNDPLKERLNTLALWQQTAFRIGDDTYLDFTGGRRLFPKSVTYDPNPENGAEG